MADIDDYDFSTGDAGASDVYNIEAGQIRVGGFVFVNYMFSICFFLINFFSFS